jgi:hypothetical protein
VAGGGDDGREGEEEPGRGDIAHAARAEFDAHMAAVEGSVDELMSRCFSLLPRLAEVESMVRVLQCVSATVELMGSRVGPHLASITGALPQVWTVISQRAGEGTGALTRLHSSLIATLAHLISKLGAVAMQDERVGAVLLPLLRHSTDPGSSEAEPLMEDGLKLWMAVLQASAALPDAVRELVPGRLLPLLRRGRDNAMAYRIAEGHLLQDGPGALAPLLPVLGEALRRSLTAALESAMPIEGHREGRQLRAIPPEVYHEASASVSLLALLLRLTEPPPPELRPALQTAAALAATDYGGGVMRLPMRSSS